MKIFSANYLENLTTQAKNLPRLRKCQNIHSNFQEPVQRLFNAIQRESYIRPHRHTTDPRDELLVVIRGLLAIIIFDDFGNIIDSIKIGSEKYGVDLAVGVEVQSNTWHTVLALESDSVLLEVKAGPFDENQPKDYASWAPEENSNESRIYLRYLNKMLGCSLNNIGYFSK